MSYQEYFENVKEGSYHLNSLQASSISSMLEDLADEAERSTATILAANAEDLARMPESDPKYDRLKLTTSRIAAIADDIRKVAKLPNPLGKVLLKKALENGLELEKRTVALGVIGIIYEARPNVTFDVFALSAKSGNACVLKGGSDAAASNKAIIEVIWKVLKKHDFQ